MSYGVRPRPGVARECRWGGVYVPLERVEEPRDFATWRCLVVCEQSSDAYMGAGDVPGDLPLVNEAWLTDHSRDLP